MSVRVLLHRPTPCANCAGDCASTPPEPRCWQHCGRSMLAAPFWGVGGWAGVARAERAPGVRWRPAWQHCAPGGSCCQAVAHRPRHKPCAPVALPHPFLRGGGGAGLVGVLQLYFPGGSSKCTAFVARTDVQTAIPNLGCNVSGALRVAALCWPPRPATRLARRRGPLCCCRPGVLPGSPALAVGQPRRQSPAARQCKRRARRRCSAPR